MLIEELNRKRIPESHNKIKKSGTTFGYNLTPCLQKQCLTLSHRGHTEKNDVV
jgi:hypothetical protein